MRLGNTLFDAEGYTSPRAHLNFMKALDLATSLDQLDERMVASAAISASLGAAGRIEEAIALLEKFSPADVARANPYFASVRLFGLGYLKTLRGELNEAGTILAEAVRSYRPSADARPTSTTTYQLISAQFHLSWNLMLRGLLDSAEAAAREALQTAELREHMNSRVLAMIRVAQLCHFKGDLSESIERSTTALELAQRYGLMAFYALGKLYRGRALVAQMQLDDGIRLCREGYSDWQRLSGRFFSTVLAADAAEVLLDAGCRDETTDFIVAGEKTQSDTGEKYQAARFVWLRGRLAQLDGDDSGAESAYREAIEIANRQGALLFALRAATSLAQLCHTQGRSGEADAVLRPIYDRFVEGFDWPDLIQARTVLQRRE
jgi:ATP/maltotriose-dependent transcriptional regulator MalT